ncbi:MAG TPA: endonuclease domain-containing protein [Thermoanaerobaculia bacterium]|nr:endonuclease domain-containing protein [Thermoanaerobaculia bacterium]
MRVTRNLRGNAKSMRHWPTRSEGRLWTWLRNREFHGVKFRRQVPIGRYIVDFYCPELKLAIEIDGRQHDAVWMSEHESERTVEIERHGIEIVRIENELLIRDPRTVEDILELAISRRRKR